MIEKFVFPQLGESVTEGTVVKWLVKAGDMVKLEQPLVEIATDKVETEIPSPLAGRVVEILVAENETVAVGTELVSVDTALSAPAPAASATPAPEPKPVTAPAQETPRVPQTPREIGNGGSGGEPETVFVPPVSVMAHVPEAKELKIEIISGSRPHEKELPADRLALETVEGFISPAVRRLLREHRIDPAAIKGTGLGGRLSKADIEQFVQTRGAGTAVPQAPAAPQPEPQARPVQPAPAAPGVVATADGKYTYRLKEVDRIEPFSPLRKKIMEHMVYSKHVAPHVSCVAEVDMTHLANFRAKNKDSFREKSGINLTYMPFICFACVLALKKYPLMNSSVMKEGIVVKGQINLSVAVDTPGGLMVPVIKDAGGMSIAEIAGKIDALSKAALAKTLHPDDMADGTFTVSNPGREGNLFGTPIINQPQVGIIRVGEIVKRPVVIGTDGEDVVAIRQMAYFTLSYDHRIIDGVYGNGFLHYIKKVTEGAEFLKEFT